MPRPITISLSPVATDADGIAQSQTPGGAGNLTLNGALGTSLTHASQIGITSVGNDSGRTFTITGTDADGNAISEAVTGANADIAESTLYFKTITSIAVDAATADAVTAGTVDEIVSQTVPLNWASAFDVGIGCVVSGTIDFTLQHCFDPLLTTATDDVTWFDHESIAAQTANVDGNLDFPCTAMRVKVNSYSSGATLKVFVVQGK